MATRGSITAKIAAKYLSVYTHWDSYPSNNGKILLENYDTQEKVEELLTGGSISSLGDDTTGTVYYARDRGEQLAQIEFDTLEDAIDSNGGEYNYCWDGESWWVCSDKTDWELLTPEMCEDEN